MTNPWTRRLAAALLGLPLAALAQGVGVMRLTTAGEYQVPVAVWYPSPAATTPFDAGPRPAGRRASRSGGTGRHALIVLSHGSGGGELDLADLAEGLAATGYIVAAPRHQGDSYDAPQGRGSDVQAIGRPWQIVATLDTLLADARFAPAIDAQRIGMAGFSAGGYTTLVMAGATPDFALLTAHCHAHPDDIDTCGTGAPRSGSRVTRPGWKLPQDTRVRAAVAMAPLAVMFDAKGLAGITIPLRVVKAANDAVVQNRYHADPLLRALPRPAEQAEVPGGHFVFVAPCSDKLKAIAPMVCTVPAGVDRAAVRARLIPEIGAFFDRTLAP